MDNNGGNLPKSDTNSIEQQKKQWHEYIIQACIDEIKLSNYQDIMQYCKLLPQASVDDFIKPHLYARMAHDMYQTYIQGDYQKAMRYFELLPPVLTKAVCSIIIEKLLEPQNNEKTKSDSTNPNSL